MKKKKKKEENKKISEARANNGRQDYKHVPQSET